MFKLPTQRASNELGSLWLLLALGYLNGQGLNFLDEAALPHLSFMSVHIHVRIHKNITSELAIDTVSHTRQHPFLLTFGTWQVF